MSKFWDQPDQARWWLVIVFIVLVVVAVAALVFWFTTPRAKGEAGPQQMPPSVQVRSAPKPAPAAEPMAATSQVVPAQHATSRTEVAQTHAHLRPLFDALLMEESKGDDLAIGDDGCSLGPYGTGRLAWQDGCEWGGVKWEYDTLVWSRWHCEWVMIWYWERHECVNDEERARSWNGGPWGPQKESTLAYWLRIRGIINNGKESRR